jgi:DNA-binding phage protein
MSRRHKPPNRGGRPSKFTIDTAVALAAALGRGQSIEAAAATAGIGISSIYRWVALGRSGDPRFATLAAVAKKRGGAIFDEIDRASLVTRF